MRYQGSLSDVETVYIQVLTHAKCLVIKPLPKESALATGHLLVVTGKDWYTFDLKILLDRRNNTGEIKGFDRQSLIRLCNISPEIAQTISKMQTHPDASTNIAQLHNGKSITIPTDK